MLYDSPTKKKRPRLTFGGSQGSTQTVQYHPTLPSLPKAPSSNSSKIPSPFQQVPEFIPSPDVGPGDVKGPGTYNPPVVSSPPSKGSNSGGGSSNDWKAWLKSDPIYQQAHALYAMQGKTNAGNYLAEVEQALLGYGSQDLARQVLDALGPQLNYFTGDIGENAFLSKLPTVAEMQHNISYTPTAAQVEADPSLLRIAPKSYASALGQALQQNYDESKATGERVNKANLFYSGAGLLANQAQTRNNQTRLFNLEQSVKNALLNYATNYSKDQMGAQQAYMDQLSGAYDRYLNYVSSQTGQGPSGQGPSPGNSAPVGQQPPNTRSGGNTGPGAAPGYIAPISNPNAPYNKQKKKKKYPPRGMPSL